MRVLLALTSANILEFLFKVTFISRGESKRVLSFSE